MGCSCQHKTNVHALNYYQLCATAFSVLLCLYATTFPLRMLYISAILRDRERVRSHSFAYPTSYTFLSNTFTKQTDPPYVTLIILYCFPTCPLHKDILVSANVALFLKDVLHIIHGLAFLL